MLEHSVADNMTLPVIDRMSRFGFVDEAGERSLVAQYIKQLRIKTPRPKSSPDAFGRQRTEGCFGQVAGDGPTPSDFG